MGEIEGLREVIMNACFESVHYGPSVWDHCRNVEKLSAEFGLMVDADIDICRATGLSHDYGAIKNGRGGENGEGHHITGARLIEPVLEDIGYPLLKIVEIQYGIIVHRGALNMIRKTPEARVVATADAWDHFGNIKELWRVGCEDLCLGVKETHKWLVDKIENDWRKVMPEIKGIAIPEYENAKIELEGLYLESLIC